MPRKASQRMQHKFTVTIGPLKLTKYERARIIGARALQISYGAPPFVPWDDLFNVTEIAKMELDVKALPISIRRQLPNGSYQDIPVRYIL
jgi:DNA-directed RNA polymerase I, II, and III subunit RPABC2